MFARGVVQPPDYRSDRTVDAFTEFAKSKLSKDEQILSLPPLEQAQHHERMLENRDDHPGCLMSGFLLVNR
jgi:hypothetical protein